MRTILLALRPRPDERAWPSGFFMTPLVDLGDSDERLRGIWTPEPEIGAEKIGISDQFLANAEVYHQRYSGSDHMQEVLRRAFAHAGLDASAPLHVLDIGTGSGVNSLVPMLSLFARGASSPPICRRICCASCEPMSTVKICRTTSPASVRIRCGTISDPHALTW